MSIQAIRVPDRDLTHLRPGEIALFRRFELLNPLPGSTYIFDLHLGQGIAIDPSWPPEIQHMATRLTQRRVDAIALHPSGTWILEIKPRAGPSAVGQLLTYAELLSAEKPQWAPFHLAIISNRNSYDMIDTYQRFGIRLFLV